MGAATQEQTSDSRHARSTASSVRAIPAFGNWDCYYNNSGDGDGSIPITQYFESARAAVLGRRDQQQLYPSFRKDQHCHHDCCHHGHQLPPYLWSYHCHYSNQKGQQPGTSVVGVYRRQSAAGPPMVRQQQLQRRRKNPSNHGHQHQEAVTVRKRGGPTSERTTPRLTTAAEGKTKMAVVRPVGSGAPKAVDEDLYKIPPELLRPHQTATSRRRSILRSWGCVGIHWVMKRA